MKTESGVLGICLKAEYNRESRNTPVATGVLGICLKAEYNRHLFLRNIK